MSAVEFYVIEDDTGDQSAPFDNFDEAVTAARKRRARGERCAVLAIVYEYADTELSDPDLDVWKPKGEG